MALIMMSSGCAVVVFEIQHDTNPFFQFAIIFAFIVAIVAFVCWLSSK